ncbi:SctD/MshK family protein [Terrihabitans sp. B22-R8]|uniref:SctD/MshK family protein n=1 Tax=Terrihabitans sp. B22-R8 TaxID=3425128 RepID=UPI00403D10DA
MGEPAGYQFAVVSGLYSGLSNEAPSGTSLIGSGPDADLVFVEQDLAPHHVRTTLSGRSLTIEALAPGVVADGEEIAPGSQRECPLPVRLDIGRMAMVWSCDIPLEIVPAQPQPSRSTPYLIGGGVLAVALLGGIAVLSWNAGADASAGMTTGSTPLTASLAPAPKLTVAQKDDGETAALAAQLQEEIDRTGLLNVKIAPGAGIVTATGTISPGAVPDWQKVQQWFDHRTNGSLTLVNGVSVREETVPSSIAVEAVWQGSEPHLLMRGQKYFVGAMLDDGWTIHKIEADRVLLSREGRLAAVRF